MATDIDVDMTADTDVDMPIDMVADVADDTDADNPCFLGPVSGGPNIFGLLIISIQPIF
jgi:hypothetical protein